MKTTLKTAQWGRVRTQIVSADEPGAWSDWQHNLVLDQGLNYFADGQTTFADCFAHCLVGSSASPNSYASGAVTFTQAGYTVTASGAFFTNPMIGGLLKFGSGSGGAEQYISAVSGDGLSATVSASATVVLPVAGVVWLVQQTGLVAQLYDSDTYDAADGNCTTTFAGDQITLLRTFVFPVKSTPYNVNEIGYSDGDTVCGRIVLPATDVVPPTSYYRVQLELTFTQSPGAPVAVQNVGTNCDTAGTFSINNWACGCVNSDGTSGKQGGNGGAGDPRILDGFGPMQLAFHTDAPPTNYASISTESAVNQHENYAFGTGKPSHTGQPVGVGVNSGSFGFTSAGETCNAILFGWNCYSPHYISPVCVLLLTTPFALPNGYATGSFTLKWIYSRTLVN